MNITFKHRLPYVLFEVEQRETLASIIKHRMIENNRYEIVESLNPVRIFFEQELRDGKYAYMVFANVVCKIGGEEKDYDVMKLLPSSDELSKYSDRSRSNETSGIYYV